MLEEARLFLQKYFGYSSFKEGQARVIESILAGSDTLAIMPTGAGKSVCYQVPSMMFDGVTLVISPLIALMKDQVDGMASSGIPATFINSSLYKRETMKRLELAGQGQYKLVYIAPERLEMPEFLDVAKRLNISLMAVDEAHCISQWGHDFRPSYRKIARFIQDLDKRPVLGAFTATATGEIREDIIKYLDLNTPQVFVSGFDRKNLHLAVMRGENKKEYILNYVRNHRDRPGIIYGATRREVDKVFEHLREKGYSCVRYHAGLSDKEREASQEAFIHDNAAVMVATNAFGMGIDKSNVRYVLHNNMPKNMEAYYQEAGRAGRDGEPGECILLFGAQDILLQKFLIEESVYSPRRKVNEYHKLQKLIDYCHTTGCLRHYILDYFGEEDVPLYCENCSNCSDEYELSDITEVAQKIISCVARVKERYGIVLIAEILKGSQNKKIQQFGFNRLSTYGLMNDYTLQQIKDLVNVLIAGGYLALTGGKFPVVKVGEKALGVLKKGENVWHRQRRDMTLETGNTLFEHLKVKRKEIAGREKIPPYIVFPDSTLRHMCEITPRDEESMLTIRGVGQAKMEKYGDEFLQVIRDYLSGTIKI